MKTQTSVETSGPNNRPVEQVYATPRVNIAETKAGYVLQAEMPGVTKAGLEVLLEDDQLTILGHRQAVGGGGELVYRESTPRDFRRVFTLDPAIDRPRITARMEQGLLTLELPKVEKLKPRQIKVD